MTMVSLLVASAGVNAQRTDPAADSAVFLLQQATIVQNVGKHNALLRALRQLRDPSLQPLFANLAQSEQAELKIHGILGLAELDPDAGLDLSLLAQVEQPEVQGQIITAALDDGTIDAKQANQLMAWPGLNPGVKLLIAVRMLDEVEVDRDMLLDQAQNAPKLGRRGLAALVLLQLGDPAGRAALDELNGSDDEQRDAVRAMLLDTAARHQFDAAADWAYLVATQTGANPILELQALLAAMRLGDARAIERWQQRFNSSTSPAGRMRLALTALQLSPDLAPDVFDTLLVADDPSLQQIVRAGRAIATNAPDLSERVLDLLNLNHPLVTPWVLDYAINDADPANARAVLSGVIARAVPANRQNLSGQLNQVVTATESLYDLDPDAALEQLRPILLAPQTDPLLAQAILLGLLRSTRIDGHRILAGADDFLNPTTQGLALLLLSTRGQPLTDRQVADLGLTVGSRLLEDTLRTQAAWCYLKYTGRSEQAIDQLIAR